MDFMFNIFSGFVITYPSMPIWWKWMNRFAPTTWILYGMGVNQLGDLDNPLDWAGKTYTVSGFLNEMFG